MLTKHCQMQQPGRNFLEGERFSKIPEGGLNQGILRVFCELVKELA
jgi:hypothetical protein